MTPTPLGTVTPLMPAIKVAFCMPVVPIRILLDSPATPASPMSMLFLPVVRFPPAETPNAMLKLPVVLLKSALSPMAMLSAPIVLLTRALRPLAVLLLPVVLPPSAWSPSGRVVKAGRVVKERGSTCGSVVATGHLNIWIASHCRRSNGGVVAARCAEEESIIASGGIIVAIAVLERRLPDGRVVGASGVHFQRTGTDSRVSNAGGISK